VQNIEIEGADLRQGKQGFESAEQCVVEKPADSGAAEKIGLVPVLDVDALPAAVRNAVMVKAFLGPEIVISPQKNRIAGGEVPEQPAVRLYNLVPVVLAQFKNITVKNNSVHAVHGTDHVELPDKFIAIPAGGAEMVVIRKMKV
jgi:hypothetical protein